MFEMEYNEEFVETRIVNTEKYAICSAFLTEISNQSYYRYIRVAKVM